MNGMGEDGEDLLCIILMVDLVGWGCWWWWW